MEKQRFLIVLCLALITTALFWGVEKSRAETQGTAQSPAASGNFRDPENVPKLRSMTNIQREEAARRAAEYRTEVARKAAFGNITTPNSSSPTDEKGGDK